MERGRLRVLMIGLLTCAVVAVATVEAQRGREGSPGPGRGRGPQAPPQITQVTRDLYKVETGQGVSPVTVFLVTAGGIILADPENAQVTTFLKEELARRFNVPVRYVIYSHYHWDHARGGAVFADTAQFVAHEKMVEMLNSPFSVAPPPGDTRDRDGDNRLSLEETSTGTRFNFDNFDANKDGFLTPQEINAEIRRPDVTFSGGRHTITLGGKTVELIYTGGRHSADLIDLYFPDQRVLFAGDYIWINQFCCNFGFDTIPLSQWIASLRALEKLDFDILINSHWASGTKADLTEYRGYLEDLTSAVQAGIKAGQSKQALQQMITLDSKYRDYVGDLSRAVGSAYDNLIMFR